MAKSKLKKAIKRATKKGAVGKRIRSDVFSSYKPEENSKFFDGIASGENALYAVDFQAEVKRDYYNRERHCWRVYSKKDGRKTWVNNLRSAKAYRLSVLWSVYDGKQFWRPKRRDRKVQSILKDLPRIQGKQGDHCRHRCGNDWCCNPGHIQIGSRKANEIDKHFHYFLNNPDSGVREAFRTKLSKLCSEHRLF
jgi:hypothetical protein